jgi:exopolysaccharide biosynthesis WecB/TagA/CpsF family protein
MTMTAQTLFHWPPKADLFGVQISTVTRDEACEAILSAVHNGVPGVVSAFDVHALMEAATKPALAEKVNRFAIIVPDGQPVRWALNWLHGARLEQNVRGSDLMWRLCKLAAEEGVSIYLYGGPTETLSALETNLRKTFPAIDIAGIESPPYRPLSSAEDTAMIKRVNDSGAGLIFLGLGCPKQDYFAAEHADRIQAVQLCVGAAFNFLAGSKATAPKWMQQNGLEWIFRLLQEPRRLWKRYLVNNTLFVVKLLGQLARQRAFDTKVPSVAFGTAAALHHLDHKHTSPRN